MHLIHIHKAPSYLANIVTPTASVSSRGRLRSDRQQLPLRAASDETQIWSALFLMCCTSRYGTLCRHHCINSLIGTFKRQLKLLLLNEPISLDYQLDITYYSI